MSIGPRIIKTGLAVAITMWLAKLINLDYPFFAIIAAIISIQPTISESFKTGWNRVLGTVIGAILGIAFALIAPAHPLLLGLGVVLTIIVCNRFYLPSAVFIATVVFVAIMVDLGDADVFSFGIARVMDTLLGVVVAFVINYFVLPPRQEKGLEDKMSRLPEEISQLYSIVAQAFLNADELGQKYQYKKEQVAELLEQGELLLRINKQEEGFRWEEQETNKNWEENLKILWEVYEDILTMAKVVERQGKITLSSQLREDLVHLTLQLVDFLRYLSAARKDQVRVERLLFSISQVKSDLEHLSWPHVSDALKVHTLIFSLEDIINRVKLQSRPLRAKNNP